MIRNFVIGKSWLKVHETPLEVKIEHLARVFHSQDIDVGSQFLGTLSAIGAMAPDQDPGLAVTADPVLGRRCESGPGTLFGQQGSGCWPLA